MSSLVRFGLNRV